ncbi:hypothetical protein Rumeso_03959 [Rubellimicrobium mesophilum DSM 19309]|uniref:Translation initiation factor 2 n=1 Tax=Rubellimicrobium mesophilum DSM 19309 TaxID=442562 RepID=A0A017HJJ2_9RHOB|nr:hypothetical protein Rumeso_03959 [Rubellimicrobium mesophilum DSM 19309]
MAGAGSAEPEATVVAGPPPVLPRARPEREAADPGWANAMAEPPGKVPHLRPQDLVPPETAVAAGETSPNGAPLQPASPEDLLAALAPGAESPAGATGVVDPVLPDALAFAPTAPVAAPLAALGGVSLAGLRPNARPEGLAPEPPEEPQELAAWDGPRPGLRPEGLAPEAAPSPEVNDAVAQALATPEAPAEAPVPEAPAQPDVQTALASIMANSPDPLAGATRQAVPQARVPAARPANFGRVVSAQLDRLARASAPRQQQQQPARQASTAGNLAANEQAESAPEVASSAAAVPSGQTAASVAQAATYQDAMALREINLIGVYGQPNARRALVRMGNGSFVRVSVGDRLDGGQVTAIGDNALNYVKRGRTYALAIPGG